MKDKWPIHNRKKGLLKKDTNRLHQNCNKVRICAFSIVVRIIGSTNKQRAKNDWSKLSNLLDKTINQNVHNIVKIVVIFRFLFDEKTNMYVCIVCIIYFTNYTSKNNLHD